MPFHKCITYLENILRIRIRRSTWFLLVPFPIRQGARNFQESPLIRSTLHNAHAVVFPTLIAASFPVPEI